MEPLRIMNGQHTMLMDKRGRISFPAAFRTVIGNSLWISPDLDGIGHLVVRSEEGFQKEYNKIEEDGEKNGSDRKYINWLRRVFTGRTDCVSPDGNGRITLNASLIEYAGLKPGGRVLVIGVGAYAEIWDEEAYRKAEKEFAEYAL